MVYLVSFETGWTVHLVSSTVHSGALDGVAVRMIRAAVCRLFSGPFSLVDGPFSFECPFSLLPD